jgi:Putative beta-barrel porin-2, OmpL-like. bbp2
LGRVNNLRAYDVSSNSFSLNQADLVIERAADLAADRHLGLRLDLQFGQATSTLQGNPANELRPDVYRNIFQAYGTYIFPVAGGLTLDFGKWSSSLGIEGNYTKDQLNYSRSFWFDYLPFYHMGVRAKLAINDQLAVNLWITNGTNQTEAFNNYKDQLFGFVLTPIPAFSWTLNYYQGQEHPDVIYLQSATTAQQSLPNQQGTYILPIANAPDGHLQIFDSYFNWQIWQALTLAAEVDYVQQRLYSYSIPDRVEGGALYLGYQFSPKIALAARAEYLADIGGLFSGTTQYLKEGTLTFDYRPTDGFLMRGEFRRDQSNQRYFIGHTLGFLETAQPTIGVGLVWWFGQKQGTW